ncbi:MAG: hypothetical protein Q8R88_11865, partial [Desulfoprunum sp.]|nr:hypothetical protein [Desulfoprunum sp.]
MAKDHEPSAWPGGSGCLRRMFRDISSLLEDRQVFRKLIDLFVHRYFTSIIDAVVGIDARGFII